MNKSLLRLQVLPFLVQFLLLMGATTVGDFILHQFDLIWIGRYLGIPGTIFILLSLFYSLRKRKVIRTGSPLILLKMHEIFAWLGALMILVHAGVHFNAILPWLALGAMVINVISGMVGRYLLERSKRQLKAMEDKYKMRGLSEIETEKELYWDAVTFDLMVKWRAVHFPISYAFAVLSIGHILSVFLFWGWK
jgi:hypothetical protein